jgi:alpha-3'-ketoglucosidase
MPRQSAFLLSALLVAACSANNRQPSANTPLPTANSLSAEERAQGFQLLFDGTTLGGWRAFRRQDVSVWSARDGAIYQNSGDGADLMTVDQFEDFELRLDWKVAPGGNSGIFYRATEEYPEVYWSAPEMQVLDDAGHENGANRLTAAGSNYGLDAAPAGVVHAAGEWNSVRIIVRGQHVEHWMNGQKVVEYTLGSPEWAAKVAASKFHDWPNYGKAPRGHIALQVHGNEVWYRSVRIRVFN